MKSKEVSRLTGIPLEKLRKEVLDSYGRIRKKNLQQALVEQWKYLPRKVASSIHKKRRLGNLSFEDAQQEGSLGLIQASKLFDISRGYYFSTYAWHAVRRWIMAAVAECGIIKVPRHVFSSHATHENLKVMARKVFKIGSLGNEELSVNDYLAAPEEDPIQELIEELRIRIQELEPNERRLLRRYYFKGMTGRMICKEDGISNQTVYNRLQEIREKLKEMIA